MSSPAESVRARMSSLGWLHWWLLPFVGVRCRVVGRFLVATGSARAQEHRGRYYVWGVQERVFLRGVYVGVDGREQVDRVGAPTNDDGRPSAIVVSRRCTGR